ncbi:MAG: hypothetical protein CMH57_07400 [Myxococcales bacterium]|nr:hypothetical protein [Myxococcales bacterium]
MQHDVEPKTGRKILRPESISLQVRQPEPGELRATLTESSRKMAQGTAAATLAHVQERELSEEERAIVKRIAFVARLMDNAVRIPGTDYHVGLDPLIGLVPLYGDWVTCGVSLYVLIEAIRLGTPPEILVKMASNIGVDVVVGFVPGLGDVFDVFFKANARNMRLIQQDVLGLPPVASENFQEEWDQLLAAIDDAEIVEGATDSPTEDAPSALAKPEAPTPEGEAPQQEGAIVAQGSPVVERVTPTAQVIPLRREAPRALLTRRPKALAPRDTSFLQKALGYTLVFGLITLFMLPWAFFAWLAFSAVGG